jgi:hypothetical protein
MPDDPMASAPTRNITLGYVVGWAWAIFAGVPGVMLLFEDKVGAGVCVISSALTRSKIRFVGVGDGAIPSQELRMLGADRFGPVADGRVRD